MEKYRFFLEQDEFSVDEVLEFVQDALNEHNSYRKDHGAPSLKLNFDLILLAQQRAERCANIGEFDQNPVKYEKKN